MHIRFGRIVVASLAAEVLGVVALIVLVVLFGPDEQGGSQQFAERLGVWVGPASGFLLCLAGGYWVARESGNPVQNGLCMGTAAALLDIAVALAIGATFAPLLFLSNAGRVMAGMIGGYLASGSGIVPPAARESLELRADLLSMAAEDLRVRGELVRDGSLFDGYHPGMREVHERNSSRLRGILEKNGWPGASLAGEDGARAAWLILQHAIGDPSLQRLGLALLRTAAATGEVPMVQVAMLEDRIRCSEGKAQRYGTQFDWDQQGLISPLPIEDEEQVDERRRALGLAPLAEDTRSKRELAAMEGQRPPQDWSARQQEKERWLRATGWRD